MRVDASCLANKFFHTIAYSSANMKTNGVAIEMRCSLPAKVFTSWADDMGRIVIAEIEFDSRAIALISLYAPNVFDRTSTTPFLSKC